MPCGLGAGQKQCYAFATLAAQRNYKIVSSLT